MSQSRQIENAEQKIAIGLIEALPASDPAARADELLYIAGVLVSSFGTFPGEMVTRTVPAGRYAKFTHKGKLDTLGDTVSNVYQGWVPQSGLTLRNAPHLEWYDERFNPGSADSEFDILLPVS